MHGRQRQAGLCEFEASLVYRASYKAAKATYIKKPCIKKKKEEKKLTQKSFESIHKMNLEACA